MIQVQARFLRRPSVRMNEHAPVPRYRRDAAEVKHDAHTLAGTRGAWRVPAFETNRAGEHDAGGGRGWSRVSRSDEARMFGARDRRGWIEQSINELHRDVLNVDSLGIHDHEEAA